jgi:amino acid adenylation domain-containing protein
VATYQDFETRTPDERFRQVAAAHPGETAIDLGSRTISYAELNELVENMASHLAVLDLPRQSGIGLLGTRALGTYVGYLAILRTGHLVVPLGPDNPVPYQRTVAELAGVRCAVVGGARDANLADALAAMGLPILNPDACMRAPSGTALNSGGGHGDDIAYVLFTSGSTGRPKGVPITNDNIAAYLEHVVSAYQLAPGARLSQTFALTFDPSVFDVLGSLGSGATLVVPRNRELLAPANYVNARGITHWYSVPSLISYARRIGNLKPGSMSGLRWSMFIGEPLQLELARTWHDAAPDSVIDNVYGPTELTISCSAYRLPPDPAQWRQTPNATAPIGDVYPGLQWLLLRDDEIVEDDGELCVRGRQRFGGYLEQAQNAGRFVRTEGTSALPLTMDDQVVASDWYRTGDRVCRHGPVLLHLGRVDRQVKVKGHRVELGDVEAAIRRHPETFDVAVLAVAGDNAEVELAAAVVSRGRSDKPIREFLATILPPYMIPARVVTMPELPLNTSGKVDYGSLRTMLGSPAGTGTQHP